MKDLTYLRINVGISFKEEVKEIFKLLDSKKTKYTLTISSD